MFPGEKQNLRVYEISELTMSASIFISDSNIPIQLIKGQEITTQRETEYNNL